MTCRSRTPFLRVDLRERESMYGMIAQRIAPVYHSVFDQYGSGSCFVIVKSFTQAKGFAPKPCKISLPDLRCATVSSCLFVIFRHFSIASSYGPAWPASRHLQCRYYLRRRLGSCNTLVESEIDQGDHRFLSCPPLLPFTSFLPFPRFQAHEDHGPCQEAAPQCGRAKT